MPGHIGGAPTSSRFALSVVFASFLALLPHCSAQAVSCHVINHGAPSDGDKAFLSADFAKAESLYRTALEKQPSNEDAAAGLIHALIREQKVTEAEDEVKTLLATGPKSAALITLRGEVELRQGEPWAAAASATEATKLDPCNPKSMLLFARLARLSSLYASARRMILTANKLDPNDPEIRSEWIGTLPLRDKISELEAFLAEPAGNDEEEQRHWKMYLDHLKKLANEPHKPCRLVSQTPSTEIPLVKMMWDPNRFRAFGLDVKMNGRTANFEVDTGAGGLLVSHSVADRFGLKPFSQTEIGGIGDQGYKPGYTAFADSITIGNLEFRDCMVEVMDSRHSMEGDGLIGMNVFAKFLVTLDYPMHKLILGPLPPRPDEPSAAAPALDTSHSDDPDTDTTADADTTGKKDVDATKTASTSSPSTQTVPPHGPYDRYIAPEMKDYTQIYRAGHDLMIPAALNGQKLKLFIIDTGAWTTTISPEAAREVTKLHGSDMDVRGLNGKVEKVYTANEVTFAFGHVSQKAYDVVAFDTAKVSKSVGMNISGFIGAKTLNQLTIHIDYRDGLVKFDYDPNRGYRF